MVYFSVVFMNFNFRYFMNLLNFYLIAQVLPKPMTPLSQTMVYDTLNEGMGILFADVTNIYDLGVVITHYRCALNMYSVRFLKLFIK